MRTTAYRLMAALALLVLWALAGFSHSRVIAGPLETLRAVFLGFEEGSLALDVVSTLYRALTGLLFGLLAGTTVGLLAGILRRSALESGLDFVRAIPPVLILPLFMLPLGYGDEARIATVIWAVTLVVSLHVAGGVRLRRPERSRVLRAMGATRLQRLLLVDVFEALPHLFAALRQAAGIALVVAVVTEMINGASSGLGSAALNAQIAYDAPALWATLVVTGAIGFLGSRLLLRLERRVVHWEGSTS